MNRHKENERGREGEIEGERERERERDITATLIEPAQGERERKRGRDRGREREREREREKAFSGPQGACVLWYTADTSRCLPPCRTSPCVCLYVVFPSTSFCVDTSLRQSF